MTKDNKALNACIQGVRGAWEFGYMGHRACPVHSLLLLPSFSTLKKNTQKNRAPELITVFVSVKVVQNALLTYNAVLPPYRTVALEMYSTSPHRDKLVLTRGKTSTYTLM